MYIFFCHKEFTCIIHFFFLLFVNNTGSNDACLEYKIKIQFRISKGFFQKTNYICICVNLHLFHNALGFYEIYNN